MLTLYYILLHVTQPCNGCNAIWMLKIILDISLYVERISTNSTVIMYESFPDGGDSFCGL